MEKSLIRSFLLWIAFEVPLGRLNPWIIGLALKRKPVRVK